MLTPEQRSEFQQLGLVRLPSAIDAAGVAHMCDSLWNTLAKHGVKRDAPETWTAERSTASRRFRDPTLSPRSAAPQFVLRWTICWDRLMGAASAMGPATRHVSRRAKMGIAACVMASGCARPSPEGSRRPPVRLSRAGARTRRWHRDAGRVHRIVEKFAAGLGPTDEGRSADVRIKLNRAEPWLRALWSRDDKVDRVRRFMTEGAVVNGVPLRVMEMTGEPGDVIIWHPWLFHCATSNCTSQPRLMLRQPINRREVGQKNDQDCYPR